jgi:putative membrane protein
MSIMEIAILLLIALFNIAIFAAIIYLVYRFARRSNQQTGASALDILKQRYARGEITSEQYQQMRRDLEA